MKRTQTLIFLIASLASASMHAAMPPATAQAAQAGIKTCLPVIEKMEISLSSGQSGNALSFWDDVAPDRNLFSTLMALENNAGNNLTNLNVMPSTDGQCVVEFTQTGYVPLACAIHARNLGNSVRFVRDLNSRTALFQGQGVQIYLTPAGQNGCLWMRKEILKQPIFPAQAPQAPAASRPSGTKPAGKSR